jgi:hypothetical protein
MIENKVKSKVDFGTNSSESDQSEEDRRYAMDRIPAKR